MRKSWLWFFIITCLVLFLISPDSALAAPGGKIVSGLFKTTWGKILLGVLFVIFSPLIAYAIIKEKVAEKRTLKALRSIAATDPNFDWLRLRDRVIDCYHRVNAAWRQEDMSEASDWMTSWYWQNQQLAYLNQWERDGLVNHCRIKGINSIRPLFLRQERTIEGTADGSRLVVSITANMEDYLANRSTGKIVEGAKGFQSTEHIWTFILQKGRWVVGNIEEGSMSLTYARMLPELAPVPTAGTSPGLQTAS